MNNIIINEYQPGQEFEIQLLIRSVYDEFVAPDYSEEGNLYFYEWIQPENIAERQKEKRNILTATIDKKIVGMIEIRQNSRISLLFVDKEYHTRGIARILFQESLFNSMKIDPDITHYFVHASPFSIPAYKKLGFTAMDTMKVQNGIKYLPMVFKINKNANERK